MAYGWWPRALRRADHADSKYQAMLDDDSAADEDSVPYTLSVARKAQRIPTWAIIAALSVALTISLGVTFTLLHQQAKQLTQGKVFSCGKTLDEAMKGGCTWDELTNSWLPAECPRAAEAEYMASWGNQGGAESWIVYADKNGTIPVDRSQMVFQNRTDLFTGHSVWWTTAGQHAAHCAYMLQRFAMVTSAGGRLDFMTANINHTIHCIHNMFEMAKNSPNWDMITVRGQSGIGWC